MLKTTLFISAMAVTLCAGQAFATTCSDDQESTAGMLAASVSKDVVTKVIPVTGKQMVNMESCDFRSTGYVVQYKYNFLAADGLYWVEATAKFGPDGSNPDVKVSRASPNMEAAEAKSGVKLASN